VAWREVSVMESRLEFVRLACCAGAEMSALCRRFGISRKTGYKWLARHRAGEALSDRCRRPHASPARVSSDMEAAVLELRSAHPSWGGRKLRRRLQDKGMGGVDQEAVPAASTVTAILARHGRIDLAQSSQHAAFTRFEHDRPKALWQMDFKGHFAHAGGRCHPLTVLDDHSRYAVCLSACTDEVTATVRDRLVATFRRYGLPDRVNVDNGSPWGDRAGSRYTPLTVWLLRIGVGVSHSRPYHPQTNGKDERFHRTLKCDVLQGRAYAGLVECQRAFDTFREVYNAERPHEALDLDVPASRYRASTRDYPEALPPIDYDPTDEVRRVQSGGWISFQGRSIRLPQAFAGHAIALRPTPKDGIWDAVFIAHRITRIDLGDTAHTLHPVTHVPEQV